MKPLDPISARMFPSLATYYHNVRQRELLALIGIILSAYVLGRDMLSAYQGRVATENMQAVVGRVNNLEESCQREFPSRAKITKVQAWNAARDREKGKEERP